MTKIAAKPARRRNASKPALTKAELRFLESQQIPLSKVFDATGMKKGLYREIMKITDIPFASGTTPCQREGHRLRTRAGHCIQCDTSKIAYMLRWNAAGYVYVAYSEFLELTKVGFSLDTEDRISKLNTTGYAGTNDWALAQDFYCERDGGLIERSIQRALADSKVEIGYYREDVWVDCNEVYDCSAEDAIDVCGEFALGV